MTENISPEEKLLKLIKGDKKPAEAKKLEKKIIPEPADLKNPAKNQLNPLARMNITLVQIQKLLIVFIGISFIYLISAFIYPWVGLKSIKLPSLREEGKVYKQEAEPRTESKSYEYYLEGLKNRQIFSNKLSQETSTAASSETNVNPDLVKDLSLVGIISSQPPQAVIEDKKGQKSYYLSKGQFIGEFQVEDIKENKIILNYKGQRYELYL